MKMRMRMKNRIRIDIPWVTLILILINVGVFFYMEINGSTEDGDYLIKMGALLDEAVYEEHEYYRLVTHFFLHIGTAHLFNNMVSLLILGYTTERVLGHIKFAILYFLSGILAGGVTIVYNMYVVHSPGLSAGASGAIFGLLGALLVIVIRVNKGRHSSAVPRYLVYLAITLYSGFLDETISGSAHAGGFIAGILLYLILMPPGKEKQNIVV